jgi:AAA+ ATPase superfamily predicted ATPase
MNDTSAVRFYGRAEVLAALRRHLAEVRSSGTGRIIAVRGRRQIGKSTVVERFVESEDTPHVFVTGVLGHSGARQRADATAAIAESRRPLPDAELLTASSSGSWREWLARLAIAARSGPVIVVLDEFPWLTASDAGLEGELQAVWDRTLEKLPVLLILVGSDVAMMERLGQHGRPLFGRLQPLVVPPLNPAEVAQALPELTAVEVFDAYLVTGGYPRLVSGLARSGHATAAEFVRDALRDAYSPLVATARITLDAEFPDATSAYQVLSAIGADDTGTPAFGNLVSGIADADERRRVETATTRALTTLADVKGLIEREVPAWAAPTSRLRRYRITDPYLRFWFRYVERQVDAISRGRHDLAIKAFDRDWSSWRGRSVEPLVREALTRLAVADERMSGVERVAPWWTRDGSVEVDVVAATESATAVLGTIKWRARGGVTAREMADLRRAQHRVPRSENARLAAISPHGDRPDGADLVFDADTLLNAWT